MAMTAKSVEPSAASRQKSQEAKNAQPSERRRAPTADKKSRDVSASKRSGASRKQHPLRPPSTPKANAMASLLVPQGVSAGMVSSAAAGVLTSAEKTMHWVAELAGSSGTSDAPLKNGVNNSGVDEHSGPSLPPSGFGIEVGPEKKERVRKSLKRMNIHNPAKVIRTLHDWHIFKINSRGSGFTGTELTLSILGLGDSAEGTEFVRRLKNHLRVLGVSDIRNFGGFIEGLQQAGLISMRRATASEFLINQGDLTDIHSTDAANALYWEKLNRARALLFENAGTSDLRDIMKVLSAGAAVTRNSEVGFSAKNTDELLELEKTSGGSLKTLAEMLSHSEPEKANVGQMVAALQTRFPKVTSLQGFFDNLVAWDLATVEKDDKGHPYLKATDLGKKLTFPEDKFLPEL